MWTPERVRNLRKGYDETQEEFAKRIRVSIETVRSWEQDKARPAGPATLVLEHLERELPDTATVKAG